MLLHRCLDHFAKAHGFDLRALLFCDAADEERAAIELQRPSRALPALFAVQYAQARLWMSWGVSPSALIGHSMGEYTAACLAGVFSPTVGLAAAAGIAVGSYLLDFIGGALRLPSVLLDLSLSRHLGQPMLGRFDWPGLALCAILAIGGVALGAWGLQRRDLKG